MTSASVVPKTLLSHKSINFTSLLIVWGFICAILPHQQALAIPPRQLELMIDQKGGSCPQPVALYQGRRLIIQLPEEIRVAIPSRDHLLEVFISGRMVVVNPQRLDPTALKARGVSSVSLTVELTSGQTFICALDVLPIPELREPLTPIELIRVQAQRSQQRIESASIDLLNKYLSHGDIPHQLSNPSSSKEEAPHLQNRVRSWRKKTVDQAFTRLLSAEDFKVSDHTPVRAQQHFIYLTIERVIRAQQRAFLRVKLHNRSQTQLSLSRVYYYPRGEAKSVTVWASSTDEYSGNQENHEIRSTAPPYLFEVDSPPRWLGLIVPLEIVKGAPLHFESSDGRTVSIELSDFSELLRD